MRIYESVEYKNGLDLKIMLPDEGDFSLFVYFHGGGLTGGSKDDCEYFANTLCKRGIGVASVAYRLYPEAKYPEFIEDCAEAVAWVCKHISEYGTCKGIYLGGSSAGGYISMMLQFDNKYLQKHGIDPLDFAGFIHDAGQPTAHFEVLQREHGVDERRVIVDETAPLYHIGLAEKYSPMLIIVCDNDMGNRYDQTQLLVSTLRHFGHTDNVHYKEMHGTHTCYYFQNDEDGEILIGKIFAEFIKKIGK